MLASGSQEQITDALVGLAYHEQDWRWVQSQCLRFLSSADPDVRGLAATCLGHIARILGRVDKELVLPALQPLLTDPQIAGRVEDALEDIRIFTSG
jgi:hypothetical protein